MISETGKAARLQAGGHQWLGDCSCLQLPVLGHPPAPLGSVELSGGHCLVTESESSDQNGRTSFFFFFFSIAVFGESNGTPFQYSCLENPMDGGAR